MKKILITKRLTALLWALVLTLMPMSLMADENTPLSVTVTNEGGSFTGEKAGNAFDGKSETKWCGGIREHSNAYVQVQLAETSKLDYYYLYTGNDINYENNDGKQQRNPKEWKLYAKVNEGDAWTLISHVTDAGLPTTVSTRSNNYKIDAAYQNIEYNYLKFQILQVEQGTIFEVGEICFINCAHEYVDGICTECGNKPSRLSFTIAESLGGFSGEGPENAIDDDTTNKWCGNFSEGNPYIVLKNDGKAKLVNYYLYTGNDINYEDNDGNQQRNPKEWKLYAKVNESDEWTVISDVTNAQLPTESSAQSNDFTIAKEFQNTYYKFFKFEIMSVELGKVYEVGELCLMGYPCHHQYEDESVFCSICGDIKEHEHIYADGIVTKEPTCTEPGEKTYTCSRCGETKTEEISPLGHNYNDYIVTKEPTCTEPGKKEHACSRCSETETEEISPLGHDYNDFIVTKEPTCTEPGEKEHTCKRCEETETEEISPLGHTFNDGLQCTACSLEVTADCIIEYTATERLSIIYDRYLDKVVFDYTDKDSFGDINFGEELFGAPAIKHEYDEATGKGRIICNAPITKFVYFTELRPDRLTSITLPSTAKWFSKEWAFRNCRNLTSITFLAEYSEGLEYWSDFEGCNNLQEIIVPYNSYAEYEGKYYYSETRYKDENGEELGYISDILKSLLPLDDTKTFETPEGEVKADATLQRSFANDGWYSLCVPFTVSVEDTPFSKVAEFDKLEGDTYKFSTVDNIEAGKAYIVKVDAAVSNPTFKNVFITTEAPATDGDFIGVYGPTELVAGCKVIGTGTTVNPANAGTMKGFRAYFPASAAGAKAMYFTVDDGVATSIQSLTEAEGYKLKVEGAYNLAGQKVDENYRGIVIKNGKKYMNK